MTSYNGEGNNFTWEITLVSVKEFFCGLAISKVGRVGGERWGKMVGKFLS